MYNNENYLTQFFSSGSISDPFFIKETQKGRKNSIVKKFVPAFPKSVIRSLDLHFGITLASLIILDHHEFEINRTENFSKRIRFEPKTSVV